MKPKPNWIRHGLLNTLELGFTRVSDALVSLLLLSVLSTESFSKLALAQAGVAPLLLLFIAPENVMYRDYAAWRDEGPSVLGARLRAFRLFAWGKAQLAWVICMLVAWVWPGSSPPVELLSAWIWAFALALAPQVAGPDREFLRLSLHLRELNWITFYQKLVLLCGTVAVVWIWGSSLPGLAIVAAFSVLSAAWIARGASRRVLLRQGASAASLAGLEGPAVTETLARSVREFSFWQHLSGIIVNWVQTMDLFFLGLLGFPARVAGLYASSLKIANFSLAVPLAMANNFLVWISRRISSGEGRRQERKLLLRFSLYLTGGVAGQCAGLALLAPWILGLISRGRWSVEEQALMAGWLRWILGGAFLFCSFLLISSWMLIRARARELLMRVYLPWLLFSLGAYFVSARAWGAGGAAHANVAVGVAYVLLNLLFFSRGFKGGRV